MAGPVIKFPSTPNPTHKSEWGVTFNTSISHFQIYTDMHHGNHSRYNRRDIIIIIIVVQVPCRVLYIHFDYYAYDTAIWNIDGTPTSTLCCSSIPFFRCMYVHTKRDFTTTEL